MQSRLIWLPQAERARCLADADKLFPLETGGAFMGYWGDEEQVVITAMIPAGPKAMHKRHSFAPDQHWQVVRIAEHYERSGRTETYLGDWHTHPGASTAQLSGADRDTLRRIIRARKARAPQPICIVIYGRAGDWALRAWTASERRSLLGRLLDVSDAAVRVF